MIGRVILVTLLFAAVLVSEASFVDIFSRRWWNPATRSAPHFSGDAFFEMTSTVALADLTGSIASFGDFNSDRFTDVFTLNPAKTQLDVYLWDSEKWSFSHQPACALTAPLPVISVFTTDVDRNGKLDVAMTLSDYSIAIYFGTGKGAFTSLNASLVLRQFSGQVLWADFNGDMVSDVIGPTSTTGATAILINNGDGTFKSPLYLGLPQLTLPRHTSSFADFDGDCHPDFLFSTKEESVTKFEVWVWEGYSYSKKRSTIVPEGFGQVTLADFDRDGTMDIVMPVYAQATDQSEIVFMRNRQTSREMASMCSADADFKLDANASKLINTEGNIVIPHSVFTTLGVRLFTPDQVTLPITLRAGDYNLDGFPDLLVPVQSTTTNSHFIQLWENVPCTSDLCPDFADLSGRRTFRPQGSGTNAITSIVGAYAAAFFDFAEGGFPSVFVLTNTSKIVALFNNFRPDSLFVKVVGLNGVCPNYCSNGDYFPDPKPYGVNYPGGTFKIALTDTDGSSLSTISAQTPQSAYLPLTTPYNLLGLGRISNYLQYLYYGVSTNSSWYRAWQGVIPNSEAITVPYRQDKPSEWTLELFISPSGVVFWVVLVMSLLLGSLGAVIIFIRLRERKQDLKIKQETRHLVDFNAL